MRREEGWGAKKGVGPNTGGELASRALFCRPVLHLEILNERAVVSGDPLFFVPGASGNNARLTVFLGRAFV